MIIPGCILSVDEYFQLRVILFSCSLYWKIETISLLWKDTYYFLSSHWEIQRGGMTTGICWQRSREGNILKPNVSTVLFETALHTKANFLFPSLTMCSCWAFPKSDWPDMNFKKFDIQCSLSFVPVTVIKLISHMYLTLALSFVNTKLQIYNLK